MSVISNDWRLAGANYYSKHTNAFKCTKTRPPYRPDSHVHAHVHVHKHQRKCKHVYVRAHAHAHPHLYEPTRMPTCMPSRKCTCPRERPHAHVRALAHAHTHLYKPTRLPTRLRILRSMPTRFLHMRLSSSAQEWAFTFCQVRTHKPMCIHMLRTWSLLLWD